MLCDAPSWKDCVDSSTNSGTSDEQIVYAAGVDTYYTVVDGYGGAEGTYDIDILFTTPSPTPTPSVTPTASVTPTPSVTATATATPSRSLFCRTSPKRSRTPRCAPWAARRPTRC